MRINLTKVRLAFPDLFTPVEYEKGDGKPRYNATFLVVPGSANDKAINEAIKAAAEEIWKTKAAAKIKEYTGNVNKFCYLDGNTKEYDGYADHMYLAAHRRGADGAPRIKDKDGKTDLVESDGRPYAGCYVNAIVEIYVSEKNPGIRANLLGVQFHSDGDAFSSSRLADDAFSAVEDGADADDIA